MNVSTLPDMDNLTPSAAQSVIAFWSDAGPAKWFGKSGEFDNAFRDLFLPLYENAAKGMLSEWEQDPYGALALAILLDQFPRNAFRGTERMYASEAAALDVAARAIVHGLDQKVQQDLRVFFYLPFGHSENLADQERAVALCATLPAPIPEHSRRHRDIVRRFGRFPHRNPILGRPMTSEERTFLAEGGFAG